MKWLGRDTVRTPHLVLCLTEAEYLKAARHCKVAQPHTWIEESRQKAVVHTWESRGQLTCVVCLHPDALQSDPIEVVAVLVHEAVHVFQRLCDSIGEDHPSSEFEAYSIERIAEQLIREFGWRHALTR